MKWPVTGSAGGRNQRGVDGGMNPSLPIMPAVGCRSGTHDNGTSGHPLRRHGVTASRASRNIQAPTVAGWQWLAAVPAPATTEPATHKITGARCYRMQRGIFREGGGRGKGFCFLILRDVFQ